MQLRIQGWREGFCVILVPSFNRLCHPFVWLKNTIFWAVTPCSPLKVNRHFGGTCRLYLQDRRINWARYHRQSRWQVRPSRWRQYVSPKRRLTCNGLHGVISQNIVYNHRCENLRSYVRMLFNGLIQVTNRKFIVSGECVRIRKLAALNRL
jgi:hypothetical protein